MSFTPIERNLVLYRGIPLREKFIICHQSGQPCNLNGGYVYGCVGGKNVGQLTGTVELTKKDGEILLDLSGDFTEGLDEGTYPYHLCYSGQNITLTVVSGFVDVRPTREYLGTRRREVLCHLRLTDGVVGSNPSNSNITFSSSITLPYTCNVLSDNAVDAIGGVLLVPRDIDNTSPITITMGWYADDENSGDVNFVLSYSLLEFGMLWDGTASEDVSSVVVSVDNQRYKSIQTTFDVDITGVEPGGLIVFKISRDATSENLLDTYPNSVKIGCLYATGLLAC